MNKPSRDNNTTLGKINYKIAILCNLPLFAVLICSLLAFQLDLYANDDGYDMTRVLVFVTIIYIIPSLAVSLLLLVLAKREEKKKQAGNNRSIISAVYGLVSALYVGFTLLRGIKF